MKACYTGGERFGRLVVVTETMGVHYVVSGGKVITKRRLICKCDCGNETTAISADLRRGHTASCGCLQREAAPPRLGLRAEESAHWKGDSVGYSGMHDRVRSTRGRAREYSCVTCGSGAVDWAYRWDLNCPKEKWVRVRPPADKVAPMCPDVDHYDPMCRNCHREFDLDERRVA